MSDTQLFSGLATGAQTKFPHSLVWTSDTTGYLFYADTTAIYYRKTTDGGLTWGAAVTAISSFIADGLGGAAIWYDRWTKDDTGSVIHMCANGRTSSTVVGMVYRNLDTATDTLSTAVVVQSAVTIGVPAPTLISITKARSGALYIGGLYLNDTSGFWISTDSGDTWTSKANPFIGTSDKPILLPGSETDTADIWMVNWQPAGPIVFQIYDNSADSWSTAVTIVDAGGSHPTWQTMSAMMTDFEGKAYVAIFPTPSVSNTDNIRLWEIGAQSKIVERTTLKSSVDLIRHVAVLVDQGAGTADPSARSNVVARTLTPPRTPVSLRSLQKLGAQIHVAYSRQGSTTSPFNAQIWWRRSKNLGVVWEAEAQYNEDTDIFYTWLFASPNLAKGSLKRFFLAFYTQDDGEVYTNFVD